MKFIKNYGLWLIIGLILLAGLYFWITNLSNPTGISNKTAQLINGQAYTDAQLAAMNIFPSPGGAGAYQYTDVTGNPYYGTAAEMVAEYNADYPQ